MLNPRSSTLLLRHPGAASDSFFLQGACDTRMRMSASITPDQFARDFPGRLVRSESPASSTRSRPCL